jgi:hypothetical protein
VCAEGSEEEEFRITDADQHIQKLLFVVGTA